jgi:Secretion system C-terminal sorting domain/Carbohydrate esterase, sialic acid-specific acetylesterase
MVKSVFNITSRDKYLTHLQNTLNMFKRIGLFIFLLIGTSHFIFSQITISSPVIRQVFQRDLSNKANLTITGSYSQPMDAIQVKLTMVQANQGTNIDWTTIVSNPLGGIFKGTLSVSGGWYKLEVRGTLAGRVVGNVSTIERVGVGEVFVIAGQSNAGGSSLFETNETGATDDRVNCANFISPRTYYPDTPFPHADLSQFSIIEFTQLKKTAAIGPTGLGPYYWGKVGDALAAKLKVPIMFFNTGWAGASVRVWRESAENPTVGVPSDFQFDNTNNNRYTPGYPYSNLSAVLSYYGINLGVRAVLWMEGETQNLLNLEAIANGLTPPVTIDNYLDNLRRLVKRTRQDLGNNKLAWVVARTSYSSQLNCNNPNTLPPSPSPIIVNAQNQAISDPTLAPMYAGPFTDNIQVSRRGERDQCVHFTGKGLDDAANAWIKALTEDNKNFFETVEPILVDNIPTVSLECVSSSQIKLSLPEGYASYNWVNTRTQAVEGNTRTVTVGSGTYIARVTRSNGNIIQIPQFTVTANTPPKAPVVTAAGDVNFCLGTSVKLQSTTEVANPIYEWVSTPLISNLPRTKDIDVSIEGTYRLRVVDKNDCASPYSAEVKLTAKTRPQRPLIATSGSAEFCEGDSIKLTSSNVGAVGYKWSSGETSSSITVRRAGTYNVQTIGANGCLSQSSTDNIKVLVNALPPTPQIRALSDTVFCDGGNARLELSRAVNDTTVRFGWDKISGVVKGSFNLNVNVKPSISINGTELVRGFVTSFVSGCNSRLSNAIQVVKKDNPSVLTIVPKSTYSLVARSDKKAEEYTWKLDGKILTQKDSLIRAIDKGSYTVIGKNSYKVRSTATPLVCQSAESDKLEFTPYDDNGLSVFPNPSNGIFNLESRYDLDKVNITIYTIDGRLIYESKMDIINSPKSLNLSTITEGTYVLRVENSTYRISKLIRIER